MTMQNGFIEQCEHEQLHLSGAIQPHGALVVSTLQGIVSHVSENILNWLGVDTELESLLDQPLPAFLQGCTRVHRPLQRANVIQAKAILGLKSSMW